MSNQMEPPAAAESALPHEAEVEPPGKPRISPALKELEKRVFK